MELGALVCTARPPRVRRLPGARPLRVAAGRPPGVRRTAAARPGLDGHRPAVPRAGCWRWLATPTGRCAGRGWSGLAGRRRSASAAWPALVADGLLVAGRRRCPDGPARRRVRADRDVAERLPRHRRGPHRLAAAGSPRAERLVELEPHERRVHQQPARRRPRGRRRAGRGRPGARPGRAHPRGVGLRGPRWRTARARTGRARPPRRTAAGSRCRRRSTGAPEVEDRPSRRSARAGGRRADADHASGSLPRAQDRGDQVVLVARSGRAASGRWCRARPRAAAG